MLKTNGTGYSGEVKAISRSLKVSVTLFLVLCLVTLSVFSTGFIFAKQVTLIVDGQNLELATQADSVGVFLQEQGITLGAYDRIRMTDAKGNAALVLAEQKLINAAKIEILRSKKVILQVDGYTKTYQTVAPTVGDFLHEAQIVMGQDDYCQPQADQKIDQDLNLKVIRVEYKDEVRYKELPYQIVERESYDLPKGQTELAQPGVNGVEEQHWQVKYEDGVRIDSSGVMTSSVVSQEPVEQIVTVGKAEEPVQGESCVTVNGTTYQYSSEINLRATAYTHTGYRTATGIMPYRGIIAVDTRVIPFGTKLYIEGYGFALAADTGGAIKGNRIDLFMDSYSEAIQWGVRDVKAYILK